MRKTNNFTHLFSIPIIFLIFAKECAASSSDGFSRKTESHPTQNNSK